MERTLKCNPPNRGDDVVAGDSADPNVGVWSGRGERPNDGVEGIESDNLPNPLMMTVREVGYANV